METASISSLASSSRKSLQQDFGSRPTVLRALSLWAASTSQTARTWQPDFALNPFILLLPWPPVPMQPSVMRLLGASAPNTDEGTIVGQTIAAPAARAEPFRKSLRVTFVVLLILLPVIVFALLLSVSCCFLI